MLALEFISCDDFVFSFRGMEKEEDGEGQTERIGEKWNNFSCLTLYSLISSEG